MTFHSLEATLASNSLIWRLVVSKHIFILPAIPLAPPCLIPLLDHRLGEEQKQHVPYLLTAR